jgi:uncharacterized protein (TIGR03435 family)
MLNGMRLTMLAAISIQLCVILTAFAQATQSAFEVASVRPSQHEVGPDYNNQITYSPDRFIARNVTLKRLIAEAWRCQIDQVEGPPWLDRNEYDVEARVPEGKSSDQIPVMLRSLLFERFHLKEHSETRQMRVYVLNVGEGGPKIQPVQAGKQTTGGPGLHFQGDMRHFADLLAVQFSIPAADNPTVPSKAGGSLIPVLDKTGLAGVYEFNVDVRPELGTDSFTAWKRALEDQLGLKIESQKSGVPVIVVEDVDRIPTQN